MSIPEQLPKQVVEQLYFLKEVLTLQEACRYLGISKSKMYKMTSGNRITFYKPEGKAIYFRKSDLQNFMLRNKVESDEEIESRSAKMSLSH